MAAAIAAFFVFSQALRYGGRLGAWSKVGSLLTDAIDLPRVEMLETAIVVAREHARSRNETILEKRLDSLVTHAKRRRTRRHDMPVVNPAFGASSPEHVRELLEARFGRTRVQRLSTKALRFWTNAHAKEAANRGQQVLGIVEEWGSVAEDLCKPFEATLADRLADIYRDERYREVLAKQKKKPAAKPTLGNYLFLMYDYKRLPGEMKTMMDSRMSVHKLPGVLKSLKELLERHRNAGAHPEPYGLRQLNELMEMLYEKDRGLWDRFLDGLTDATAAVSVTIATR